MLHISNIHYKTSAYNTLIYMYIVLLLAIIFHVHVHELTCNFWGWGQLRVECEWPGHSVTWTVVCRPSPREAIQTPSCHPMLLQNMLRVLYSINKTDYFQMSKKGEFWNTCRGTIKGKDRIPFSREKLALHINRVSKITLTYADIFYWYKCICTSNWFHMYCNYILVHVPCIRDILFFVTFIYKIKVLCYLQD